MNKYRFVAVDSDGEAFAFENKPIRGKSVWKPSVYGEGAMYLTAFCCDFVEDWAETLEEI